MRRYQKIVSGIFTGLVEACFAVATRVNILMPHWVYFTNLPLPYVNAGAWGGTGTVSTSLAMCLYRSRQGSSLLGMGIYMSFFLYWFTLENPQ